MNSFKHFIIPVSSRPTVYWAYVGDGKDTLEPFHPLYYLYSKHHNLPPKNVDPSIVCEDRETLLEDNVNYDLLTSLPKNLCLKMVHIQYEDEHDLCLQLLSRYEHSQNYILESEYHDSEAEHLLSKRGNDTSLPKQYEHLNNLLYVMLYDNWTYNKYRKFIETESSCIRNAGF